jgi:tetratricopeptide (TPR) repeat protein
VTDWDELHERAIERFEDGEQRLPDDPDARQRQLTRMGNAAGAAGLTALMAGRDGREWLLRAAETYRRSWEHAPPGSWGRPIGAMKARIMAGDWEGAAGDARWALEAGAAASESEIGRYAAALAHAVLGEWDDARAHADYARTHEAFPSEVADALAFVAAEDVVGYVEAVETVLESFETRDEYLEDVPVADTVLVLQALAARRGMAAELSSPLLPTL